MTTEPTLVRPFWKRPIFFVPAGYSTQRKSRCGFDVFHSIGVRRSDFAGSPSTSQDRCSCAPTEPPAPPSAGPRKRKPVFPMLFGMSIPVGVRRCVVVGVGS